MKKCEFCGEEISEEAKKCKHCGEWLEENPNEVKESKNKTVAFLLAWLLGGLGAHKFYLGKAGQGIFYLLFCWTFFPSLIAFIEGIQYISMSDSDFKDYVKGKNKKEVKGKNTEGLKVAVVFLIFALGFLIVAFYKARNDKREAEFKSDTSNIQQTKPVVAQEKLPEDTIKRIEAIVNKVSSKMEVTIWDGKENFASETTKPPYEVIINAGNGDIASCHYAKNVSYEIMKGLYSDEITKNKISRVRFTSWGHLKTSIGSVDGAKTDWGASGPTNFWKVLIDNNFKEDETGALNQRTWGEFIGADCK